MKRDKHIPAFPDIPKARAKMGALSLDERKGNFNEVELGFTEEQAIAEAKRCLSCRRCIGCGLCLAECNPDAIKYDQLEETITLDVDAVVLTPGYEEFDAGRKRDLGYRQCQNVITTIELERILDPDGPYGGVVMRPYDGMVPDSVAFVQCVGSREEMIGANYCSNVCCMTAMKEAVALKEKDGGVAVKVFFRDVRPLGKDSEHYYLRARDEHGVEFVKSLVTKVEEQPETHNLVLHYTQNGQERQEEFSLVVLSVGLAAPRTVRSLRGALGVRLNKYNFCTTSPFAPLGSSKEGIFVAGAFSGPKDMAQSVSQASGAALHAAAIAANHAGEGSPEAALVIGGGVSGLTAALGLASRGIAVHLVEASEELGGRAQALRGVVGSENPQEDLQALVEKVQGHKRITVHTGARVTAFSGDGGGFSSTISRNGQTEEVAHGAVVVAAGGKDYSPDEYGYGQTEGVLTQAEFGELLAKGEMPYGKVVMIQCVGSRNKEHPWCSRVCCVDALQNALGAKGIKGDAEITILHRDVRVYGFEEDVLTDAQDAGVRFVRMDAAPTVSAEGGLKVSVRDRDSGEDVTLEADAVVLSTGIVPSEGNRELAELLGVTLSEDGFFNEAHPTLRPVEAEKEGIFLCGLALSPQTVEECISQAAGAAGRAATYLSTNAQS